MSAHNVLYFRQQLASEKEHLQKLCERWNETAAKADIPDECLGQIRLAVGQAQLLMDQRFHQFSGLIDNCEFHRGEKKTTCDDLQGFWDMIFFQVEDVNQKFNNLEMLEKSKWSSELEDGVKDTKALSKTVTKSKSETGKHQKFSNVSSQMKMHILAARQRLAEAKARTVKSSSSSSSNDEENKENEKVFEMPGFFTVNSPVKIAQQRNKSEYTLLKAEAASPLAKLKPHRKPEMRNYIPLACVTRSAKKALQMSDDENI
ncbi:disks large-associated protein 5-like isoform X2 [Limulus polyphemus]|uniref:Disks large-associated protein 5-like isoform X2 n=1 Tax=Limulus polyphemus TaxID=6850 RepID=A0ABM1SRI2_LIMPO|nr:disks large-associated protein 5-like isoform X2 [Limulus polyphemus]